MAKAGNGAATQRAHRASPSLSESARFVAVAYRQLHEPSRL